MKKKALFIDRDGTIVVEPPVDYQLDSFEKLAFIPGVMRNLAFIAAKLDYELVMVTNQDGLGTDSFPEETFWPVHNFVLKTLEGEGIRFSDVLIDRSFPQDNAPTRKPRTGMLGKYTGGDYDLASCFVIGDRLTDVELAKNLGCRAIRLGEAADDLLRRPELAGVCALVTPSWERIAEFLFAGERTPESAMKLAGELDADTVEQQDALFRLYYYAASADNPEGAQRYAECVDPSRPAWGTIGKDGAEAWYYYGKSPEGESARAALRQWAEQAAQKGDAQAAAWLREMK